ncbi:MAG: hypothetical protein JJ971_01190 [Balneolaceae bacterium]|nr:hypothetical protein [Balneolaceae bacterium]MBO6544985.1 hypothetical protein [Balneolaceae bacterium]MBO6646381.1 hypothetical protein [Balneolaceae bacterium]
MQLCFFSDEIADNFLPLTLTRPVSELRVGILTIREKWERSITTSFTTGIYKAHLQPLFDNTQALNQEDCIWINSRFLPTKKMVKSIFNLPTGMLLEYDGLVIAARISFSDSKTMLEKGKFDASGLNKKEADFETNHISFLWDLLSKNGVEISADIERLGTKSLIDKKAMPNSTCIHNEHIFIEEGAVVEPGSILMANEGPIYIGKNTIIEAGSILKGPVAICESATVKMNARIYNATTVGPVCKVGGEVSNSIFHSYSNKGHDGFVGNSLIGQWCNLGADTNTSNLKNNYGIVYLQNWKTKKPYKEGIQFFGTVMGDHSKTSINTALNTGTACGVSSNIFVSGFPPKYIPSFSWLGDNKLQTYRFEKAIEAMQAMMKRRGVHLDDNYGKMMKSIFDSINH